MRSNFASRPNLVREIPRQRHQQRHLVLQPRLFDRTARRVFSISAEASKPKKRPRGSAGPSGSDCALRCSPPRTPFCRAARSLADQASRPSRCFARGVIDAAASSDNLGPSIAGWRPSRWPSAFLRCVAARIDERSWRWKSWLRRLVGSPAGGCRRAKFQRRNLAGGGMTRAGAAGDVGDLAPQFGDLRPVHLPVPRVEQDEAVEAVSGLTRGSPPR